MKYVLFLAVLACSFSTFANPADRVCKISGTSIAFDLVSLTPQDDGSRFFGGIYFYFDGNYERPEADLTIKEFQTNYVVSYADGFLEDGTPYFMLQISDPVTYKSFYVFENAQSKTRQAFSRVVSTLPVLNIPESANATVACDN